MDKIKIDLNTVSIGADIEWFIEDITNREIISAEGLIRGTKEDPYKFDPDNPYFATSLDCVLAEGNIPPTTNPDDFLYNIRKLQDYIESTLPDNLRTKASASERLNDIWLMSETARTAGCQPSFICWTEEEIAPGIHENLRSAGFHVHVGYPHRTFKTNYRLGKCLDLFLTAPAVLIEPENERQKAGYFTAGNIRHQDHGVELRTLSSWFTSNDQLIRWVYFNTISAINFYNTVTDKELAALKRYLPKAINNRDTKTIQRLLTKYQVYVPNFSQKQTPIPQTLTAKVM